MITFDIVYLTYRSEKWIDGCLRALAASRFDLKRLNLYFVDNNSGDGTVEHLRRAQAEYADRFGAFVIKETGKNLGFGGGNNVGAKLGSAPYLFFCNIDTAVFDDTLLQLSAAIEQDAASDFALWELRQFPYEHPKIYDPLTGETSWSSGAAFAIRREVYERIEGFDERFFMYGEDVDLSWRVRTAGYRLRYVPRATINHYCYQTANQVKPTQYLHLPIGNLLLRTKFGTLRNRAWGHVCIVGKLLLQRGPFPHARTELVKTYFASMATRCAGARWRRKNKAQLEGKKFCFYDMDYELSRTGAYWACARPKKTPLVSVIVRTCGRPAVLRETLVSLRNQTYSNIEVVVVEDGKAVAKDMIRQQFSDMNIRYHATGKKVGRCAAGNLAMGMASGRYFNFLDDDDVFYADHVETLVAALEQHPEYRVAYALGFQTPIRVHSREPYRYDLLGLEQVIDIPFSRMELLYHNCFPIQCVMFERSFFERYGGLDTTMDVLEDWDLWLRYASENRFLYVPKTTSQYRVPADRERDQVRQQALDEAYASVKARYEKQTFQWTGEEINREYQQCIHFALMERSIGTKRGLVYRALRKVYHLAKRMFRRVRKKR